MKFNEFIGIPYKEGGRDLSGADCWGIAVLIHKKYGITLPDYPYYTCDPIIVTEAVRTHKKMGWIKIKTPTEPCIIAMKLEPAFPDFVSHTAVYIGKNRFIHNCHKKNTCIERMDHPWFSKKIAGFYKYAG